MSKKTLPRGGARIALAVLTLAALPGLALAEDAVALTADGRLIRFDTASPGSVTGSVAITGTAGAVVAIDTRPADGLLYCVTDSARLYRVNAATGVAVEISSGPAAAQFGGSAAIDFNPVTDRLRVLCALDRNLRLDADAGVLLDGDLSLPGIQEDALVAYANGDVNFLANPGVVAVGYTGGAGAGATTLFGIDTDLDVVVTMNPPNSGTLLTVGPLGVDASGEAGLDISPDTGDAFAVLTLQGQSQSGLYEIDLSTGAATSVGPVADLSQLRDVAILPDADTPGPGPGVPDRAMLGVTASGELVAFRTSAAANITARVPVTGLLSGDTLVAVDTRPANGRLYGLGASGRIYVLSGTTGIATPIRDASLEVALTGTQFGFDFDAATNRIRIVSDTGLNVRVHPDTGAVIDGDVDAAGIQADANLAFAVGDVNAGQTPRIVASASNRNDAGTATTLFAIDADRDVLVRIGAEGGSPESPNAGTLHTIGSLGVDITGVTGFEIVGNGTAIVTAGNGSGGTQVLTVDLTTGAATPVGTVGGGGDTIVGVTEQPTAEPLPPAATPLVVTKMKVLLHFDRDGRDRVMVQGTIPFPQGTLNGLPVTVDVGGFSESFVLQFRGRAKNPDAMPGRRDNDFFRLVGEPEDGRIRFKTLLRLEDLSDQLADENMGGQARVRKETRSVRVTVTVDGTAYTTMVNLRFNARRAHWGRAKIPRAGR